MPKPRPVTPRPDMAGADLGTLAQLGHTAMPDPPSPEPPRRRHGLPGPRPDRTPGQARITDALTTAGISPDADDQAAIAALAGLDERTAATIAEWIGHGRPPAPPGKGPQQ